MEVQISRQIIRLAFAETDINRILAIHGMSDYTQHILVVNMYSVYDHILKIWYQQSSTKYNYPRQQLADIGQYLAFSLYTDQPIQDYCLFQKKSETLIHSLLLSRQQNNYSFILPRLKYFNAAQFIIKAILSHKYVSHPQYILKSKSIRNFIKQWFQCDRKHYDQLLDVVLLSRSNKSIQKSSAAALTVLNMVGVKFIGKDLSGISIPNAILNNGSFDNSNMCGANLTNVSFYNSSQINVKFDGSDMRGCNFGNVININFGEEVKCMDIDKAGKYIIAGGVDGKIILYDTKGYKKLKQFNAVDYVIKIKFSIESKLFATSCNNRLIQIWDIQSQNITKIFKGHSDYAYAICFSPDGNHLVSGSDDTSIKIWDIQTSVNIKILKGHADSVLSVNYSPNGNRLVSGSLDCIIKTWDIETGNNLVTVQLHNRYIWVICYSYDGNKILSASHDGTIKIWDAKEQVRWEAHKKNSIKILDAGSSVYTAIFSGNGKRILSACTDRSIKIWDIQQQKIVKIFKGHKNYIFSALYFPDEKKIISCSQDHTIKIWNLKNYDDEKSLQNGCFDQEQYANKLKQMNTWERSNIIEYDSVTKSKLQVL